jgi:CDP-glycerol glycerophosphotransferase (TagB/SpsB family)
MLAIPGLGPLVGEGTLKAGLAGLGVESAVGNFAKYLINLGVPELEAKRYEDRLKQQAILLTVRCESPLEEPRLREIVKSTGGQDVSVGSLR